MTSVATPRVTAIVVTYRSASDLPACLAALAAQEGVALDLVVVDNASDDDTAAVARRVAPSATVIANEANVGYGRANNQVLLARDADWFAIVNPDAIVPPRGIADAVGALAADPSAGVAGLRHVGSDGRDQPSAFPYLGLVNLFGEMSGLDRLLPFVPALSTRRLPAGDPARPRVVDWLQGSFLVVRGAAVKRVGGFDPAIFMYGEDLEWCWRLAQGGFRALYLPEPAVRHAGGASGRGRAPELYVEHLKSRIRFFARHRGAAATFLARTIVLVTVTGRWALAELAALASAGAEARERRALFRAAARWAWSGAPL